MLGEVERWGALWDLDSDSPQDMAVTKARGGGTTVKETDRGG